MIDPSKCCLFVGPQLKKFKLDLFLRIGRKIDAMGGSMIHGDFEAVKRLPDDVIPIVGCSPELRQSIEGWTARGRQWIYWDRGYARRVFATWLPRGELGGYYRWHVGGYQMQRVRDVPGDRWAAMATTVKPWAVNPNGHIHIAAGSPTYDRFHQLTDWVERTKAELQKYTPRKITVSDKESKIPLGERINGAHALVTHGSIGGRGGCHGVSGICAFEQCRGARGADGFEQDRGADFSRSATVAKLAGLLPI